MQVANVSVLYYHYSTMIKHSHAHHTYASTVYMSQYTCTTDVCARVHTALHACRWIRGQLSYCKRIMTYRRVTLNCGKSLLIVACHFRAFLKNLCSTTSCTYCCTYANMQLAACNMHLMCCSSMCKTAMLPLPLSIM